MIETETPRSRNFEFWWFALAVGLALSLRLLRLGEVPLTDDESRWALQALDLVKGQRPEIGPQPAYVLLTALSFFVFQASNFAARLVPALFGTALVAAPYFFRNRLGSKAAIVLAFVLAFEPGLLALSRLAGSPLIAVSAGVLAWGLWRTGKIQAAGILAGIALLGGPLLWPGLIGLAIAYGLSSRWAVSEETSVVFDRSAFLTVLAYAAGTYLLLGSFFLFVPGALGAGLYSTVAYFGGWLDFTDVPAWRLLLGLSIYQFAAVLLGLVALVRGIVQRDSLVIALGFWLLAALVLALAYPFRQVSDLAWVILPLWSLAALEISRYLVPAEEGTWETYGMMAFTLVLLLFAGSNFVTVSLLPSDSVIQLRWIILVGSLAVLLLSVVMVAYGWSLPVAMQGSAWGVLIALGIYSLSVSMASGGLRTYRTVEMWPTGYHIKQADMLAGYLDDISRWKMGTKDALDVSIVGVDSPALRWVLRDWNVTYVEGLTISGTPSVMVASDQFTSPDLEAGYRGERFVWRTSPAWNEGLLSDWLRWWILHDFPQGSEQLILWVRSDVFIDSQSINP